MERSALRLFSILAILVFCASLPASAGLVEIKDFDKELAAKGIPAEYSDSGMAALLAETAGDLEALKKHAAEEKGDDREEMEEMADAVGDALARFSAIAASDDAAAKHAAFPALKSMLYSLRSEVRGRPKEAKLADIFGFLRNLSLEIPYLSPDERNRPLTREQAEREAVDLEDPRTGKVYREPADLAGLTSEQVSRLDIRPDHHLWYSESELHQLTARHGTAWKALETRIEERVGSAIHAPYSLDQARRVLLFDRIRTSGTSPKIDASDLYGEKWKVKWGEEVQTEALANHLYLALGGKFEDLVYVNQGGPRDLVLVLDRPGHGETGKPDTAKTDKKRGCEKHVATPAELKSCLLESGYKFDLSPYVLSQGVITEALLQQEPFSSLPAGKADLVGREFVTFSESLVEFEAEGDGFFRLGAGPMSSGGALEDRVKRGLAILCYWIQNKDAKDENNRGVIDRGSSDYFEYMHDMGASLGSAKISGNPNLLKVGDAYVRRRRDTVKFTANVLYLPKAFRHATYADAAWMARKIVGLSREEILAAVAGTRWPDFQQDILASRLIARRNAIAHAFDVGDAMPYELRPTVVALGTPADRLAAVTRYRLGLATQGDDQKAVILLERFMQESGIPMDNGLAGFEDKVDQRVIQRKGAGKEALLETSPCEKSILVALLENTLHPAGLDRRVHRASDDKPPKACRPTAKTLGIR